MLVTNSVTQTTTYQETMSLLMDIPTSVTTHRSHLPHQASTSLLPSCHTLQHSSLAAICQANSSKEAGCKQIQACTDTDVLRIAQALQVMCCCELTKYEQYMT
jgi:hypothetical protein